MKWTSKKINDYISELVEKYEEQYGVDLGDSDMSNDLSPYITRLMGSDTDSKAANECTSALENIIESYCSGIASTNEELEKERLTAYINRVSKLTVANMMTPSDRVNFTKGTMSLEKIKMYEAKFKDIVSNNLNTDYSSLNNMDKMDRLTKLQNELSTTVREKFKRDINTEKYIEDEEKKLIRTTISDIINSISLAMSVGNLNQLTTIVYKIEILGNVGTELIDKYLKNWDK